MNGLRDYKQHHTKLPKIKPSNIFCKYTVCYVFTVNLTDYFGDRMDNVEMSKSTTYRIHRQKRTETEIGVLHMMICTLLARSCSLDDLNCFNDIAKMVPKTTVYKRWNCQVIRPANCCHLILSNRFLGGFPNPSQFAAA